MNELSNDGESTLKDINDKGFQKTAFDWKLFESREKVLRDLKDKQEFVDIMLMTEDGGEETAHFTVLSALGKKFSNTVEESMNSTETPELNLENGFVVKKVLLKNCNKDVLKIIVDCAYNGFIKCDSNTIWDLIETAELYELEDMVDSSLTCLIWHLNIDNCIKIFHLGVKHKHKSANASYNFIKTHFNKIVEECVDFPLLTLNVLLDLLVDDELNVKTEKVVWNAIIRWINFDINKRRIKMKTLLTQLRFHRIEFSFIADHILTNPLISEDIINKNLINKFIKEYKLQTTKKDGNGYYVGLSPITVRPRIPHEVLFAFGGWQEGIPSTLIETFDIRTNLWFDSNLSNDIPRAYHGIQTINGLIYIIGGTNGTDILNTVHVFNTINKKWYERFPMIEKRCYVSIASIDHIIYAMGGHNGVQRIKSCEKYDTNINQWTRIEDMNVCRSDASAAVHERNIYIAGGLNDHMIENTVEMYNPIDKTWTFIQPMTSPRTSFGFVSYKQSLYAIGGNNGFERVQSVERFDFNLNSWLPVANMKSRRSTFASCVIEDEIYVVGGYNGQTPICLVEKYNDLSKVWSDVKSIRHDRSGLNVCVVKGLSDSIDYTFIGHKIKKEKNRNKNSLKNIETEQTYTLDEEELV